MTVKYYDGIIPNTLADNIYEYCQNISWYQEWIGYNKMHLSEYIPAQDGKTSSRHFLDKDLGPMGILNLLRFSMYRHPFAWGEESLQARHSMIYDLWTIINDKVFDGGAEVEGLSESIAGLSGYHKFFKDGTQFRDKYNIPLEQKQIGWKAYFNARCAESITGSPIGNRVGQIHKDSSADVDPKSDRYYTVLYVVNREWQPDWGADFLYYGDDYTGAKHWKHDFDIGWASQVIGNRPGRVIVYPHNQTHLTNPPKQSAPEMSQRVAFRVRIK